VFRQFSLSHLSYVSKTVQSLSQELYLVLHTYISIYMAHCVDSTCRIRGADCLIVTNTMIFDNKHLLT